MSKNRFYTLLLIPEKTSTVRKILLPSWVLRGSMIAGAFVLILSTIMVFDYWYVMSEIGENKDLKTENRKLKQQVQVFKNKMSTIESTLDRIKTFSTRLKVITNIETGNSAGFPSILDKSSQSQNLLEKIPENIPDASLNIGGNIGENKAIPLATLAGNLSDNSAFQKEFDDLNLKTGQLNQECLLMEQTLQDQYELLTDQKAFLSALPTRKPAMGYYTSGFGVRKSPYSGREKMHEGLDIANHLGTGVRAPADGVVSFADIKPGYGQTLVLDHGYGLETWYAHARKILVKKGQKIKRGDPVALLGNTGRSTGPHLHYEVHVHGTPVDPLSYILEN